MRSFASVLVLLVSGIVGAPALYALEPATGLSASTGQLSTLTLSVVSDGSANTDGSWDATDDPGEDSSANNGIVRTHDTVIYRWGYSVATAGDITMTQTLPEGMSWVASESTAVCTEGTDAVSDDGRTLTCTQADQATGAGTYQVRATVNYGTQGQELTSVLSSDATSTTASATVTVSAAPSFDMRVNSWSNGFTLGGESGEEYGQSVHVWVYIYQTIDSLTGVRGSEGLTDTFTFTVDPSDMGEGAMAKACWANAGNTSINTKISGGTSTAANSVVDAGTWSCSQDEAGGPITVTVTDAVTDLRSYPTETTGGTAVTGRAYATFGQITLWIPNEDYPEARTMTVQISDFDPDSASGQSNYGDGYTTGQEPGAAAITGTNATKFTFAANTEDALVPSLNRVYDSSEALVGSETPIPDGTTSVTSGLAPMNTGETLRFGGSIKGTSPWGTAYTDVGLCAVWDEALLSGGVPELGYGSSDIELTGVEYAHLDVSTDAERRSVDCGSSGDGATEWSSSYEDAGGDGVVNAVRFTIPELPFKEVRYLAVPMTRTDLEVDAGTPLALFWQVRSAISDRVESTFDPTTQTESKLGSRALTTDGEVSVEASWDASVTTPGTTQTVTVQPSVVDIGEDTLVAVTLPAGTSVVAGSWPSQYSPSIVENSDGSSVYTFALGDLADGEVVEPITLDVVVSAMIDLPTTVTATAVITSVSDARIESFRTATASIAVNAAAAFSTELSASSAYAVSGVPLTYTFTWVNGLDDSQGDGSFVVLLPFEGDSRGTTGLTEALTLDDVQVSADMDVTVQYTTDAAADVEAALASDRSGDTGITWLTYTDGADLSGATAVRFVTGEILAGTAGEAEITVTPGAMATSAELVTDLSGTVTAVAAPLEGLSTTTVVAGNAELSGNVYLDTDYEGVLTSTSEPLSGVQVRVTGYGYGANGADDGGSGDDIVVDDANAIIGTTDDTGAYLIDGLMPGVWTIAVDESSLPDLAEEIVAAETPESTLVVTPAEELSDVNFGYVYERDGISLADVSKRVAPGGSFTIALPKGLDSSAAITAFSDTTLGTVVLADDGLSLTYTAGATPGTESFTYTAADSLGASDTATVTVEVVTPPTATSTERVVGQGTTQIDLTDLFTGDEATIAVSTDAEHGSTDVSGNVVSYQPSDGYAGNDSFTYTVTDSFGLTASASVRLIVLAAPVVDDIAVSTLIGQPVTLSATELGIDLDGLTVTIVTEPGNGTVTIADDGSITYTPADGWVGTDSIVYQVTDVVGQQDTATISVRVAPAVTVASDSARTGVGTAVELDVLANDTVESGSITAVTQAAQGTVEIVDAAGTVRYTPADGFSGTDTFTYTVTDSVGQSAVGTVTVTVVAAPVAEDVTLRVGAGTQTQVDLADWVTGDGVSATVSTGTTHGTFTVDADGAAIYQPDTGYLGTDGAVVTWTDSVGQTTTQTVSIEVVSGPIVPDSAYSTGVTQPLTIDLLAGASATTVLTVTGVSGPANGTLAVDGSSAVYTAADGFSGTDSFTVTATDADGLVATGTVTITVYAVPDAPPVSARTAVDVPVTLQPIGATSAVTSGTEGVTTTAALTASATVRTAAVMVAAGSITRPEATVTAVTQPEAGSVELGADGVTLAFTPQTGWAGTSTFTYTVTDDLGQSAVGTAEVRVVALTATDIEITVPVNSQTAVDVLTAVDGENVQIDSTTAAQRGAVELAGSQVTYTAPDSAGSDSFTATVTDDLGQTAIVSVRVTVTADAVDGDDDEIDRLSHTGSEVLGVLALAVMMAGAGLWLIVLRRRRSGTQ